MASLLIRDLHPSLHKKIRQMAVNEDTTIRATAIKLLRVALAAVEKSKSK